MSADLSPSASSIIRALQQENKILKAERDRYHKALYKIVQFDDGLAGEIARDALDSTTITHEEAVSDAEAVLEDHYIYGKE